MTTSTFGIKGTQLIKLVRLLGTLVPGKIFKLVKFSGKTRSVCAQLGEWK